MNIILFEVIDDQPGAQIHLARALSDAELVALNAACCDDIGQDGDSDFSAWLTIGADSLEPARAFLRGLTK